MERRFVVEAVTGLRGEVIVFAAELEGEGSFTVDAATLAGCPLKPVLNQPRALTPDGQPRYDLWAFHLRHRRDRVQFIVGETVVLRWQISRDFAGGSAS